MKKSIPLLVPDINSSDVNSVSRVLETGQLVQGSNVSLLEKELSNYLGVKHAIAVSSGTAGLHLALISLGIKPNDEVIIPAFSFVATANAIELCGAKCIFVDVDNESLNININLIESKITKRTKAIVAVHEFGFPADIQHIRKIALKHDLKVLEDAACAIGSNVDGIMVGTNSEIGVYSFHPRKIITGGEGGLIVTNDDNLAKCVSSLRNHGIEYVNGELDVLSPGFNYRITEFQAALILSQFNRISEIIERRSIIAHQYLKDLKELSEYFELPNTKIGSILNWQTFHIVQKSDKRKEFWSYLKENGIQVNLGAQCIPEMSYYRDKYNHNCEQEFPVALKAFKCGTALPCYEKMTDEEVEYVIDIIKDYCHE